MRSFRLGVALICIGVMRLAAAEPASGTREHGVFTPSSFASPDLISELRDSSGSELRPFIDRYETDRSALDRFDRTPASMTRLDRSREFNNAWLAALDSLDFDSMSQHGQVDYLLFRNKLEYELRDIEHDRRQLDEMAPYIPFAAAIVELQDERRRLQPVNGRAAATTLTQISMQIEEVRSQVEEAMKASSEDLSTDASDEQMQIKRVVANRAADTVDRLRWALGDWFRYSEGYDPVFTWWANEPFRAADSALHEYAKFLRERVVGIQPDDKHAIIGDPIGREALISELSNEMIPYTPEELIDIANREFAWCEREMLRAAHDLGFGDDWQAALEHVKTLHVEPGAQPEVIRELAFEAEAFLEAHDLVTISELCRNIWRVQMMSPERQLVTPYFTGGEVISVSFPTDDMTHEQKLMSMRGNNIHFSRATVHHELIPGHHLQGFMTARYREYRRPFNTPFWGEGWALYWEMLLWDLDFARSAEDRVGMLFWRMHRCARIIFSLNFHLEQMTPEECIEFLVDRVGHERANATAEVRRSVGGSYGPLYQAAYMLGGLQFRALHQELVESGSMTNREFHDAVLRLNSIPVEMVRATLIHQPLTRDFESSWRFYDELEGETDNHNGNQ